MSFWTDLETSIGDVMPTFAPGSLEYALTEYAGIPSQVLAPVVQMIRDAAPNVPADFDYTQAVQNMVAKQNAQFGGFTEKDFYDGQLPAKLFEQLPGGATAMQNLRQLPSFQNAQALGAERQRQAEQSGDSFLGGIARPFLDTARGLNEMRKEGALAPILAFAGPAFMPSNMPFFGGTESGAAIPGFDISNPSTWGGGAQTGYGAAGSSSGAAIPGFDISNPSTWGGGGGSDGLASLATGNFDPMGSVLTQASGGGATSGLIQQLANFTGLSTSAIERLGGAAISSLASLVSAGMTADAAKKAAQGIADSNANSNQLMAQINAQNQARQEPFYQAGLKALPAYSQGVMPGGNLVRPFSNANFQADPGYGFRLSEGMKTLENSAASRGNLLSGATLKGAQRYGQGLASQEYQNAYNRYTGDQATQRNALASLTGFAPTASSAMQAGDTAYGSNAANLASNTANAMAGAGATRSSSYGNALAGIGQNVYNAMNPNPMNAMMATYMQNQMTPRTGVA